MVYSMGKILYTRILLIFSYSSLTKRLGSRHARYSVCDQHIRGGARLRRASTRTAYWLVARAGGSPFAGGEVCWGIFQILCH